jgi:hypothetical protein
MKADPQKVITEIIDLKYVKAYTNTSLVQYLKDKYDINQARSYVLIREAQDKAGEIYNELNNNAMRDSILFMEEQRQKAINAGERKLALDYQKELNKVNQLYIERQEIKLTGSIDVKGLFGFEDEIKEEDKNDKTES